MMHVLRLAFVLGCLVLSVSAQSKKGLPAYVLSNWNSSVAYWSAAKNCPYASETVYPGFQAYARGAGLSAQALNADSFAIVFDGVIYGDPRSFSHSVLDGGAVLLSDGTFEVRYDSYNGSALPFELLVQTFMPPDEDFYITSFGYEPKDVSAAHSLRFLSFVQTPKSCASSASFDSSSTSLIHSMDYGCDQKQSVFLVSHALDIPSDARILWQAAEFGEILNEFQSSGGYLLNTTLQQPVLQLDSGFAVHFDIEMGTSPARLFSIVRSIQDSATKAQSFISSFNARFASFTDAAALTATRYTAFLKRGLSAKVTARMSVPESLLYQHSLLALKNGQNPTNGGIVASFHPLYGYKMWSRDAVFASIILTAAGYAPEARAFLLWASTAELRDDGAFHTCYNFADGSVNGFVEPQYDGTALYITAVLYYVRTSNDASILQEPSVVSRLRAFSDFFLNNVGYNGLAPADYSIWEESSDQHTGAPIATQYFTFTQAMAFGGLRSASVLESKYLQNTERSATISKRSADLQNAILEFLWDAQNGTLYRGIWSDSLKPDTRLDSSSAAAVFLGLLPMDKAKSHVQAIAAQLTRFGGGIARYAGDAFFYDGKWDPCGEEVSAASPPWGVTTMFTAFAELSLNLPINSRIKFMLDTSAAEFSPVGEAVDGITGEFVRASAPDIYEHGGVYIFAQLLRFGLALPFTAVFE
jgi:hypothetical protein